MRRRRRWLPLLLVGVLGGSVVAFGGSMVVTDYLEQRNTFCISCHLHEQKFADFHPVAGTQVTLAAAHNLPNDKNVKCIDCHIGATMTDKLIVKYLAARDTVTYLFGTFEEPQHLRFALGSRTCLKCHTSGGQNTAQDNAFHNAPHHTKMPPLCYDCHTVHPPSSVETRFLRERTVRPLCDQCHKEMEQ